MALYKNKLSIAKQILYSAITTLQPISRCSPKCLEERLTTEVWRVGHSTMIERTATKVHRQLVELDILTRQDNHLNIASINGAAMVKKMILITRHKLSLLVNLLFWWDDEMNRWDDLEARKTSYAQQLEEAQPEESAEERMKKVNEAARTLEMVQRNLPSQRQENRETSWNTTGGIRREFELREMERRMAETEQSRSEVVEDEGGLPAYRHGDNQ